MAKPEIYIKDLTTLIASTKLPDFLIAGAQKAGTTSLAEYLTAHPDVARPKRKEVHFFDLAYGKGVDWYRSHFPTSRRRRLQNLLRGRPLLAGDASPYYLFHPLTSSRCSELLPRAKIIIMLRDPVARAYSHYHHELKLGMEPLAFAEALAAEPERLRGELEKLQADPSYQSLAHLHYSYCARGIYLPQVSSWLKHYSPDQVLIVSSEEFFRHSARQYHRVLEFLGLRRWDLAAYPAQLVGSYKPLDPGIQARLAAYFAPHNRLLREHLNRIWPGLGDAVVNEWTEPIAS